MNLAPNNRAARFAGWPDLWFFEHDDRLHAVTQQARMIAEATGVAETQIREAETALSARAADLAAIGKAFAERQIDPKKMKIMSSGEPVDETAIKDLVRLQADGELTVAFSAVRGELGLKLREAK